VTHRPVLVIDCGAQYAQLIARRVREAHVYSEIVPHTMSAADMLSRDPVALIISGGPSSVYEENAPTVDPEVFTAGVPLLGICYGHQLLARALGGVVAKTGLREYGRTEAEIVEPGVVLEGSPATQSVWMSHGDAVHEAPEGFAVGARTAGSPVAVIEDRDRRMVGVQWHPEVRHTPLGQDFLEHFLYRVAGIVPDWTNEGVIDEQVRGIRDAVGDGRAICGLSGGVDSAVAAALVQKAIGDRLTCIFVDHGLLRAGEAEQVERDFVEATGVTLVVRDARRRFLDALKGLVDPEDKRKAIGREFIREFEGAAREVASAAGDGDVRFLVQGTVYPDVVESGGGVGAASIKSHHNVGGLPDDLEFDLVEPLRTLFKDEVRAIGIELGLPEDMVWRHPFPGPGLAIRIIGEVTEDRLDVLRAADLIVREELTAAGLDREIWQCPVVLLADVRSVGVQGDDRTYGYPVILRLVSSEDAMTADWYRVPHDVLARISTRITNEVTEVNRVALDVTSKPPGTIEWE